MTSNGKNKPQLRVIDGGRAGEPRTARAAEFAEHDRVFQEVLSNKRLTADELDAMVWLEERIAAEERATYDLLVSRIAQWNLLNPHEPLSVHDIAPLEISADARELVFAPPLYLNSDGTVIYWAD